MKLNYGYIIPKKGFCIRYFLCSPLDIYNVVALCHKSENIVFSGRFWYNGGKYFCIQGG